MKPLTRTGLSATLHCLTGCSIGEVAGIGSGKALVHAHHRHAGPADAHGNAMHDHYWLSSGESTDPTPGRIAH